MKTPHLSSGVQVPGTCGKGIHEQTAGPARPHPTNFDDYISIYHSESTPELLDSAFLFTQALGVSLSL